MTGSSAPRPPPPAGPWAAGHGASPVLPARPPRWRWSPWLLLPAAASPRWCGGEVLVGKGRSRESPTVRLRFLPVRGVVGWIYNATARFFTLSRAGLGDRWRPAADAGRWGSCLARRNRGPPASEVYLSNCMYAHSALVVVVFFLDNLVVVVESGLTRRTTGQRELALGPHVSLGSCALRRFASGSCVLPGMG